MKIETKDEIIKNLRQYQDKLKAFGVSQIGLFGSFVTGKVQKVGWALPTLLRGVTDN